MFESTILRPEQSFSSSVLANSTKGAHSGSLYPVVKGVAAGAAAGALAMTIQSVIDFPIFGELAREASTLIAGEGASSPLIAGAAIGAVAGAVRAYVVKKFPQLSWYEKTVNVSCGMFAGTVTLMAKCIVLFSVAEGLWRGPFDAFCRTIAAGIVASFLAPVGITAAAVARWATQSNKPVFRQVKPILDSYNALEEAMRQSEYTLFMTDQTGKHREVTLGCLGKGGSKKAVEISKDRALILPNMDVDSTESIAERWERMVLEEVEMSKLLSKLGMLSPLYEQVSVTIDESSEQVIPVYVSKTFEGLGAENGWFIIDTQP